jgi:hypothetical protein
MTTFDDEMERTPAGIPVSLRPFFQEYVLEDLDPERSAFTVIERTLAWGEVPELRWLCARRAGAVCPGAGLSIGCASLK